jgi:hypothetical protein
VYLNNTHDNKFDLFLAEFEPEVHKLIFSDVLKITSAAGH